MSRRRFHANLCYEVYNDGPEWIRFLTFPGGRKGRWYAGATRDADLADWTGSSGFRLFHHQRRALREVARLRRDFPEANFRAVKTYKHRGARWSVDITWKAAILPPLTEESPC